MTPTLQPCRSIVLLFMVNFQIAIALAITYGHFDATLTDWLAIGILVFALDLLVFVLLKSTPGMAIFDEWFVGRMVRGSAVCFMMLLATSLLRWPAIHLTRHIYVPIYHVSIAMNCAIIFYSYVYHLKRSSYIAFLFLVALAFALRLYLIPCSPAPTIDVWSLNQFGCEMLWKGIDPFTVAGPDIYKGKADFGYPADLKYIYPPGTLLLHMLPYKLFGDVRYGYIIAELIAVILLTRLAGGRYLSKIPQLLILMFLWQPTAFFVIEQAWTEPYLVMMFTALVYCLTQIKNPRWSLILSAVFMGFVLSLKQYTAPLFPLYVFVLYRRGQWQAVIQGCVITGLAALLPFVPFLLWHPKDVWENGVMFLIRSTTFRGDALSLTAGLYHLTGIQVGKSVAAITMFAVGSFCLWRSRSLGVAGFVLSSATALLAGFLVGTQAFCNYYYFIMALTVIGLVLLTRSNSVNSPRDLTVSDHANHIR